MQNLGIWGLVGAGVKICHRRCHNFGIADPDLPIHYAAFMGLLWWL